MSHLDYSEGDCILVAKHQNLIDTDRLYSDGIILEALQMFGPEVAFRMEHDQMSNDILWGSLLEISLKWKDFQSYEPLSKFNRWALKKLETGE